MTINSGEYKSIVGLDSLYIAKVTTDDSTAYTPEAPTYLAPAAEASVEPTTNAETQYADDKPYDAMVNEGETTITLQVTGVPLETLASMTGKVFDATTGRLYDNAATPPYFALGFRSKKSNGSYRYFWFLKGRFEVPGEAATTQSDTPDPKTIELKYTGIFTTYEFDLGDINDQVKRVIGDEDTDAFSATDWFTTVQVPAVASPSALALSSSVPTDGASSISVSANQTLTFNNMLQLGSDDHVTLVVHGTGAAVAMATGYPSLSTSRLVITLDPNASLTASTEYDIYYSVTDVYGQILNGVVNFTTA